MSAKITHKCNSNYSPRTGITIHHDQPSWYLAKDGVEVVSDIYYCPYCSADLARIYDNIKASTKFIKELDKWDYSEGYYNSAIYRHINSLSQNAGREWFEYVTGCTKEQFIQKLKDAASDQAKSIWDDLVENFDYDNSWSKLRGIENCLEFAGKTHEDIGISEKDLAMLKQELDLIGDERWVFDARASVKRTYMQIMKAIKRNQNQNPYLWDRLKSQLKIHKFSLSDLDFITPTQRKFFSHYLNLDRDLRWMTDLYGLKEPELSEVKKGLRLKCDLIVEQLNTKDSGIRKYAHRLFTFMQTLGLTYDDLKLGHKARAYLESRRANFEKYDGKVFS